MSEADRRKWDTRYRAGSYAERRHPSALLEEWLPRLPRGSALDVACGAGRNALHLAAAGYSVDAVDIAVEGLQRARAEARRRGLTVHWIQADLELQAPGGASVVTAAGQRARLPDRRYQAVIWIRYVNPHLMPLLIERLAPGGYLLCEQHLKTTCTDVAGPSNAAFRLAPGALRQWAAGLHVLDYREGPVEDPDGRTAALAQLVARRDVVLKQQSGAGRLRPAEE